jgi:hypothetical protein
MEMQVYVARFPSGTGRRRVTATSGNQPLWRHDSRALFFRERRSSDPEHFELRVVTIGSGETLTLGAPETLFELGRPGLPLLSATFINSGAAYRATPDGRRFLMVQRPARLPLTEIVVVQHWDAELRRLPD